MQYSHLSYEVANNVGWIKLNRPNVLNALSSDMIKGLYELLLCWKDEKEVALICLEGEGDRAFCSGGDVRNLYDHRDSGLEAIAQKFFETEYRLNMLMHTYPKPILTYMNGYVMGGGVGISIGNSHRIITEKTKWAMPEMHIGLYPDVGGSYFLPKMPGYVGRYLALTSKVIGPEDILYIGAADYLVASDKWLQLKDKIRGSVWSYETVQSQLNLLFDEMKILPDTLSQVEKDQIRIDKHFCPDTMEGIIHSLEEAAAEGDEWASEVLDGIRPKSPTSLKVTLQQMINGIDKPMDQCFAMELNMSMSFMKGHDFFEGVRAVLVDKDRSPKWMPATLEEVSADEVQSYFEYGWPQGKNPLSSR